jgi:carboxymethylenebutenolidase
MFKLRRRSLIRLAMVSSVLACTTTKTAGNTTSGSGSSAAPANAVSVVGIDQNLPPDAEHALSRLNSSTRHGEWVMISIPPSDSVRAWVVYPESNTKVPVIVVIHEIFGLSDWIRSVADQFAADGFIAIAPDLLTMKNLPAGSDSTAAQAAMAAIRTLDPTQVQRMIDGVARYGMALPAAKQRYGIVGFCWGGGVSFEHATHAPSLGAAVVYYGVSPATEKLSMVQAPVLGLYGGNDARVDATIPSADSALRALGKTYSHTVLEGAGHGFLRQQNGMNGANLTATQEAWPATIAWFRRYLGS